MALASLTLSQSFCAFPSSQTQSGIYISHCPTPLWLVCTAVGGCNFCFCWLLLLLLVCFFALEDRSLVGEQVDVVNLQQHTMCSGHSMLLSA
jgi:hypothetical protein